MKRRRAYTKVRRAQTEAETRSRIVDALLAQHEDVGPARTTVSAVAERAGVERLTVYRHFPDEASMLQACSSRWAELNPAPGIALFAGLPPVAGTRRALLALYRWYRANERLLTKVLADAEGVAAVQEVMRPFEGYLDELTRALERLWPGWSRRRKATLRHAVDFSTWRSLSRLTSGDRAAISIVLGWLE